MSSIQATIHIHAQNRDKTGKTGIILVKSPKNRGKTAPVLWVKLMLHTQNLGKFGNFAILLVESTQNRGKFAHKSWVNKVNLEKTPYSISARLEKTLSPAKPTLSRERAKARQETCGDLVENTKNLWTGWG